MIIVLSQYIMVSNILWMFVEGLFLYNSIVVIVFFIDVFYKFFCVIGWGKYFLNLYINKIFYKYIRF